MASSEAMRVYAAEDALEKSSPTQALSMDVHSFPTRRSSDYWKSVV